MVQARRGWVCALGGWGFLGVAGPGVGPARFVFVVLGGASKGQIEVIPNLKSMCNRNEIDVESKWDQCEIEVKSL